MRLHVSVLLDGVVVEDTVVAATAGARLGEHDDAVVAFPGADLVIHRDADGLRIRGHRLDEGACLELPLGRVDRASLRVVIRALPADRASFRPRLPFDVALPVLIGAIVLLMLGSQAATQALNSKADVSVGVARAVEALLLPPDLRRIEPTAPRTIVIVGDDTSYPRQASRPARFVDQVRPPSSSDRPAAGAR